MLLNRERGKERGNEEERRTKGRREEEGWNQHDSQIIAEERTSNRDGGTWNAETAMRQALDSWRLRRKNTASSRVAPVLGIWPSFQPYLLMWWRCNGVRVMEPMTNWSPWMSVGYVRSGQLRSWNSLFMCARGLCTFIRHNLNLCGHRMVVCGDMDGSWMCGQGIYTCVPQSSPHCSREGMGPQIWSWGLGIRKRIS